MAGGNAPAFEVLMSHKLKCISPYRNGPRGLDLKPGDQIEDPETAAFLLNDSPASFEIVKPKAKRKQARPRNKAVKTPQVDK